jgi:hypothetical protein
MLVLSAFVQGQVYTFGAPEPIRTAGSLNQRSLGDAVKRVGRSLLLGRRHFDSETTQQNVKMSKILRSLLEYLNRVLGG